MFSNRWYIFALVLAGSVIFVLSSASGQSHQIRFEHLTVKDGLSQNSGLDILQDSHGFLWIGTQIGLNRYNGYTFTHFRHEPENPSSLSNEYVRSLFEDDQRRLWVGTKKGLHVFNEVEENFERYDISALLDESGADSTQISNDILAIAQANINEFWLGTSSGLVYFNIQQNWAKIVPYGSLNPVAVNVLKIDSNDQLWIGDSAGNVVRRNSLLLSDNLAEHNQLILKSEVLIRTLHIDKEGKYVDRYRGTRSFYIRIFTGLF